MVGKRRPSFPRKRDRVRELSELAGEFDLGNELGSRLMMHMPGVNHKVVVGISHLFIFRASERIATEVDVAALLVAA
jgi:hypothetical protein